MKEKKKDFWENSFFFKANYRKELPLYLLFKRGADLIAKTKIFLLQMDGTE